MDKAGAAQDAHTPLAADDGAHHGNGRAHNGGAGQEQSGVTNIAEGAYKIQKCVNMIIMRLRQAEIEEMKGEVVEMTRESLFSWHRSLCLPGDLVTVELMEWVMEKMIATSVLIEGVEASGLAEEEPELSNG